MDYPDYVNRTSFKVLKPQAKPGGFRTLNNLLMKCGVWLEAWNTKLPEDGRATRACLGSLLAVPRYSTFAIAAIINRGVAQMPKDTAFVNVGVWHGFTFLAGMAGNPDKTCVGIDNFSEFGGPRNEFLERFEPYRSECHRFHEMDYREYFAKIHKGPIGYYIYDGDHAYAHQLEGLRVAEPFLVAGAFILVDDVNWDGPTRGTRDFVAQSEHKYAVVAEMHTRENMHPTLWNGIMLLQKLD